jgi:cyclopropane fatty-acyl-phospholipid synthase-like methyltransferase
MQKLLDNYEFETVLDIGCGAGEHSERKLPQLTTASRFTSKRTNTGSIA